MLYKSMIWKIPNNRRVIKQLGLIDNLLVKSMVECGQNGGLKKWRWLFSFAGRMHL